MGEVCILMKEYFILKDQMKRLKEARAEFMQSYQCENIKQDDFEEPPKNCHQRRYGFGQRAMILGLVADACEPCKRRHWYFLERKKNATRRSTIMRLVRHKVITEVKD